MESAGGGARAAACAALAVQAQHWPRARILEPRTEGLPGRDAGLAQAIYEAGVRRWLTLERLVSAHLERPFHTLAPVVRAGLIGGAAQLVLLDRVPAHAALDETVEWVKGRQRRAAGLVNAVLRRVVEMAGPAEAMEWDWERDWGGPRDAVPMGDGRWRRLSGAVLSEDPLVRLSESCSVPEALVRRWLTWLPMPRVREVAWSGLAGAPIVLNARHAVRPPTVDVQPHEEEGFFVYTGPREGLAGLLEAHGDVWVQDASSAGAVEGVGDLEPRVVVDLCAGQGTKTRQLAALFGAAEIVATDIDRDRLGTLRGVFAGHERVSVVERGEVLERVAGRADLVLLDVPCSNTGVLGRRIEARYRADRAALRRLNDAQRQLVADAIPMLSEGGRILYATCSVEREENERVAAWARKWHRLRARRERRAWPTGGDGSGDAAHRDGAYSVLLGG